MNPENERESPKETRGCVRRKKKKEGKSELHDGDSERSPEEWIYGPPRSVLMMKKHPAVQ